MNLGVQIMHSLLESIDNVHVYSIFFKQLHGVVFKKSTAKEERLFGDIIADVKPDVVGFSVMSSHVTIAKSLTKLVRENSSAFIIWGGVHPTISPEACIKEADAVCVGEGEGFVIDIVEALKKGRDISGINNLWLNHDGEVIQNSLRPLIQDLDSLPYPAYYRDNFYLIESNRTFNGKQFPKMSSKLHVTTTRGCPFGCAYCINSVWRSLYKGLGKFRRQRSPQNVIGEILYLKSLCGEISSIRFNDEVFVMNEEWVVNFTTIYAKKINAPFVIDYTPTVINISILKKLKDAGLTALRIGIQGPSDYIRNEIFNRPGNNAEIPKIARKIVALGIEVGYDLIFDHPYEDEQSYEDGIKLFLELPKPLTSMTHSLIYFPEYPLTKRALKDGYITEYTCSPENMLAQAVDWYYKASLFPFTRKNWLKNILYLMAHHHPKDELIRKAVFEKSIDAKVWFVYLNVKLVILNLLERYRRKQNQNKMYRLFKGGLALLGNIRKSGFAAALRNRFCKKASD